MVVLQSMSLYLRLHTTPQTTIEVPPCQTETVKPATITAEQAAGTRITAEQARRNVQEENSDEVRKSLERIDSFITYYSEIGISSKRMIYFSKENACQAKEAFKLMYPDFDIQQIDNTVIISWE